MGKIGNDNFKNFIDEVKAKNDLVDVCRGYFPIEKRGMDYWARCPLHHEKTASFCIDTNGQFYYCYGCHKSGDVISLVQELDNVDFNDAVRILAERAKIPMPDIKYDDEKVKAARQKRDRLFALLKDVARYYCAVLRSGKAKEFTDYATKRGLSNETLNFFGIGCSKDYHDLVDYLLDKGYTHEEMVESRAIGKSEKNGRINYYDPMANRFIIPMLDQFGNVLGFSGRRIDGITEQKYVNTSESPVFTKGKTLFNINNLKKVKNEEGIDGVIMVEGHMDVVSMVQAGIKNVVASMGTAFTKDQARLLKRYSDTVYISYDGDSAGQTNTIRSLDILKDAGLEVKVVPLTDGLDPDDVIRKFGAEGYRELLNKSIPLIDFKIETLQKSYDIKSLDGKRKFVSSAIKVVRESDSPAEQEDLLKKIRDLTGITYESLQRELFSVKDKTEKQEFVPPTLKEEDGDKITSASRFVLAAYLGGEPVAGETDLSEIEFTSPVHHEIKKYILERKENGLKPNMSDLYEIITPEFADELSHIAGLLNNYKDTAFGLKAFDKNKYFADCVKTLKISYMDRENERLLSLLKSETDLEKRKQLTQELATLIIKKNKLGK